MVAVARHRLVTSDYRVRAGTTAWGGGYLGKKRFSKVAMTEGLTESVRDVVARGTLQDGKDRGLM